MSIVGSKSQLDLTTEINEAHTQTQTLNKHDTNTDTSTLINFLENDIINVITSVDVVSV